MIGPTDESLAERTAFWTAEIAINRASYVHPESGQPAVTAPSVEKRLATAKARAAMAGVELHAITDDRGAPLYCCVKWAMVASFTDLAQVEEWLGRIEGKR